MNGNVSHLCARQIFLSSPLSVLLMLSAQPGSAQAKGAEEAPPPQKSIDEVVVTGSHIRGTTVDGPSPVIAFDKEAIERTGVATMQQFFDKLPQNFGGGANASNVSNASLDRDTNTNIGLGSTINLRGLGTGTTLTLINGHRVTSSSQFQFVDTSMIPMSAVERVEILTDGASAIYGSDAIGGVVNIVLRRDFTGYETQLRYGSVTSGSLREIEAAQTGGWSWDGGHALLSYEFLSQDHLSATDKDFSKNVTSKPYDLYPESRRHTVYASATQELTTALSLDFSGSFADRDVTALSSSASGRDERTPSTHQYDLAAGLKFDFMHNWQARLNAAYGQSEVDYSRTRTTPAGVTSRSVATTIDSDSWYLDLAADGDVVELPAGSLRAAFGVTRRQDSYEYSNRTSLAVSDERTVSSVYGEATIPLLAGLTGVRSLDATAAIRYDDYSDFGSTTNPKFGLVWESLPGLRVRGTYGTSFRAPVFQDMITQDNSVAGGYFPNPASPNGRTLTLSVTGGNPDLGPEKASTWTAGLSFTPDVAPNLSLQLNYYHIKYTDRIDRGFPANVTTLFAQSTAPYASILIANPTPDQVNDFKALGLAGTSYQLFRTGAFAVPAALDEDDVQVILDNRVRNNAIANQDGLDFSAHYSMDLGQNRLGVSFAGQYILHSTRMVTATAPEADVLNQAFLPVDLRFRAGIDFARHDWTAALFLNHAGDYEDPGNTSDRHVPSWSTVDMSLRWELPDSSELWRGTSFALNIQNLFDRDPPFVVTLFNVGYDPTNANPLGRFVSLTGTRKW